jgi:hypothetical protein
MVTGEGYGKGLLVGVTSYIPQLRGLAWLHCFPCPCRPRTVVAEPPKLYGSHVLIFVLKTSNNQTWVPQNLRSLFGVLGKPESSTIF